MDESYANVNLRPNKILHDTTIKSHDDIEEGLTAGIPRPAGVGQRLIIIGVGNEDGWLVEPLIYKRLYRTAPKKKDNAKAKLLTDLTVSELKAQFKERKLNIGKVNKALLCQRLKAVLEEEGIDPSTYDFKPNSQLENQEDPVEDTSTSQSCSADYHDDMDSGKFEIYLEKCMIELNEGDVICMDNGNYQLSSFFIHLDL